MHERAAEFLGQGGALEAFHRAVEGRWAGARRLGHEELKARFPEGSSFASGWRLPAGDLGIAEDLILVLGGMFPHELPRVGFAQAPPIAAYPHVEANGLFCIVPPGSITHYPIDIRHAEFLVDDAVKLIAATQRGERDQDFVEEASTYWTLDKAYKGEDFWLVSPAPETSRELVGTGVGEHLLIAARPDALERWMAGVGRKLGKDKPIPVAFIAFEAPLYPRDYPKGAAELVALVQRAGADASRVLEGLARPGRRLPVVLSFKHGERPTLLGLALDIPKYVEGSYKARVPIWQGFREETVPGDRVLQLTATAQTAVKRSTITEVHRRALLTRTTGRGSQDFSNASVIVIGCGSLGSAVAMMLAQSGVGRLRLVDPELLGWQNVGRHVLPGTYVGNFKARALAQHMRAYFPDLDVEPTTSSWEAAWQEDPDVFDSMDLIVSALGEWSSESLLNQLTTHGPEVPPVIFGWLEAFGLAGHAVSVMPGGGCLRCLTDDYGRFVAHVAHFDGEPPIEREAGCSVVFQPFGAPSVAPVATLVTDAALDALRGNLRSEHRTWVGPIDAFDRAGALISKMWFDRLASTGHERTYRDGLQRRADCAHCSAP